MARAQRISAESADPSFDEDHSVAIPADSMAHLLTADELLRLHVTGKATGLWRGRLLVTSRQERDTVALPRGWRTCSPTRSAETTSASCAARIREPGSNPIPIPCAPDVAVVCRSRVGLIPSRGYAAFAPDLVAEIVSPDARPGEVLTKVGQWIDAGTMLVWVIDPSRVEARTYRGDGGLTIVSSDGLLDASPVLPGFTCALAEVLR